MIRLFALLVSATFCVDNVPYHCISTIPVHCCSVQNGILE